MESHSDYCMMLLVLCSEKYNKEIILSQYCYLVVDVYSDWSGPCTGMVSILKKIKMEIGGDALSYATVMSTKCNKD